MDLIDRQDAIEAIRGEIEINGYGHIIDVLRYLPSARPEHTDCTECEEYDHETHSCPKYCRVIKQTLKEAKPQRKTGKWIVVNDGYISGKCSVCGWEAHMYEDDVMGMDYCPNCGAKMEGES